MEMGYEDARVVDTGLVLGLGCGGRSCSASGHNAAKPQNDYFKISSSLHGSGTSAEPSLTLGRQFLAENMVVSKKSAAGEEQRNGHPSSPQSMASSLSNNFTCTNVKRERVDVAGEDVDAERAISSRVSDEDDEASAKKKLRLTKEQSALLEERFKEHSTLNPKQKVALAKQLNLRPRQVEVWFQNRRARTKLKQTEVDCEFLKRCCESLTDENRRLQKELQQLRALKLATPLYMQIPAATTLTMCPSCERINGSSSSSDDSKEASTIVVTPKPHFYNSFTRSSSSAAC